MKIKTGSEIKTGGDIETLVVSIIFRMENCYYTQNDLLQLTWKYLEGCNLIIAKPQIMKIIDEKLDMLQRNNFVTCKNGKYETINYLPSLIKKTNYIFSNEEKIDLGILN